jgi:hypothetical protein
VIAEEIKKYMKLKKTRKACRELRPWPTARKCLEANPGEWLDRYPVN